MTRNALGLAAVLALAAPAFGQAPKPEDVVKKAIDAHGGADVLNKYPAGTSDMKGTLAIAGQDIPFTGTLAFAVPGKVRLELNADVGGQKVSLVQVINGNTVTQLQNGKAEPLTETMKDELLQTPALQEASLLTPLLDGKKYTLTAGKDEDVDGKPAAVVAIKAKGIKETKLFFDKAAGALVRMERKALNPEMKEVSEATTFSDYKKVSGMLVPMKSVVTHDGKPFMDVTVSNYKPLEKLDDKVFSATE